MTRLVACSSGLALALLVLAPMAAYGSGSAKDGFATGADRAGVVAVPAGVIPPGSGMLGQVDAGDPDARLLEVALVQSGGESFGIAGLAGRPKTDLTKAIGDRLRDLGGAGGIGNNQVTFEIWLIVNQLLDDFPKSREALLLRKDRYFGLTLATVSRGAETWKAANPDLAAGYAVDPTLTEVTQTARDSGGLTLPGLAGLPSAQGSTSTTPAKLSLPSWFRAPKQPGNGGVETAAIQVIPPPDALPSVGKVTSRRDLFERLKATTVLVVQLGMQQNGKLVWFAHGTGSFISPTRVLTNTHVVESEKGVVGHSFLVISKTLGISRATVLARGESAGGKGVDAAILDVQDYRNPNFLPFTKHFSEGAPVVLSGFAGKANALDRAFADVKDMVNSGVLPTSEHIPNPKFSSGSIQAVFIDTSGEETVAADIEATNGASGSPIVNSCGQIVALLYAVSTSRVDKEGYVDASMYNYSASAREVTKWLDSARVPYSTAGEECDLHE